MCGLLIQLLSFIFLMHIHIVCGYIRENVKHTTIALQTNKTQKTQHTKSNSHKHHVHKRKGRADYGPAF